MNVLTVVLIAKNEEDVLAECLDSVKDLGGELVLVDTGSTDKTIEIAESYGARVEHFEWCDDFSAARNYAESKCKTDYIFWIDADEKLIAGHDIIKKIVGKRKELSVRPLMAIRRDEFGGLEKSYARQDLLHRKGSHTWEDAYHEYTQGPNGRVERGIIMEEIPRPGGDRSHGDNFSLLRKNLQEGKPGNNERHFFYLIREHAAAGHWVEAISLVDTLLTLPVEWPVQRSHAAIYKGEGLFLMDRYVDARKAYLRAVEEWGRWAEPYFALGNLHYHLQQWLEGAAWLTASLRFDPPEDGHFTEDSIYRWKRWDLLGVCLFHLERLKEAEVCAQKALEQSPKDPRLIKNVEAYSHGERPSLPGS